MPRGKRRYNMAPKGFGGAGMPTIVMSLTQARGDLAAQRAALDNQIAALDRALDAMGASAPARPAGTWAKPGRPKGGRGRRGPRAGSLKEYIGMALRASGGAMAVKDITAAVLKGGYPTKNKTLAKSVGIALTQMSDVSKIGRGMFRAK